MGKVNDWLIEMEEDASYMTRQEFMDKHGETVAEVYDELQLKWQHEMKKQGRCTICGKQGAVGCCCKRCRLKRRAWALATQRRKAGIPMDAPLQKSGRPRYFS